MSSRAHSPPLQSKSSVTDYISLYFEQESPPVRGNPISPHLFFFGLRRACLDESSSKRRPASFHLDGPDGSALTVHPLPQMFLAATDATPPVFFFLSFLQLIGFPSSGCRFMLIEGEAAETITLSSRDGQPNPVLGYVVEEAARSQTLTESAPPRYRSADRQYAMPVNSNTKPTGTPGTKREMVVLACSVFH